MKACTVVGRGEKSLLDIKVTPGLSVRLGRQIEEEKHEDNVLYKRLLPTSGVSSTNVGSIVTFLHAARYTEPLFFFLEVLMSHTYLIDGMRNKQKQKKMPVKKSVRRLPSPPSQNRKSRQVQTIISHDSPTKKYYSKNVPPGCTHTCKWYQGRQDTTTTVGTPT